MNEHDEEVKEDEVDGQEVEEAKEETAVKKVLTKKDMLGADDMYIEQVDIDVPGWNGVVCLKSMTGSQRDEFEASMANDKNVNNLKDIRARLLVRCITDEAGTRLFKQNEFILLSNKNAKALDLIFDKAMDMNGMRKKDVEEMAENFGKTQGEDSSLG